MIKMSKIFRISGNYTENGEWAKCSPAFAGKIVVNEMGKFYGWCEQFCTEGSAGHDCGPVNETNKIRCLVGALAEEGEGYSLLFYKLPSMSLQTPLLYEIHSASAVDCVWSAEDPGGGFVSHGNAEVVVEEIPYSENAAISIRERFCETDISLSKNDWLIREVDSWQAKNLVLWM